jgi:hypothetical protein
MWNRTCGRVARLGIGFVLLGVCVGLFASSGCSRKERVADVQTPVGDVKVDRDKTNGDVEVNVDAKK